ncbi:MAG TPA: cytochrome c nitrite reductase small subunit [Polyangiaceae bacterium]|nr:cytochrome c nitrite reductase small subunit [Polyangiaceae bacterium]
MGSAKRIAVSAAILRVAVVVGFGVAIGVGLHTFRYAEGLAYLKTDPKACANCHIMQPQYDGWQQASHHTGAVCVDCHLPQAFVPKYLAKLENGWRHGEKFTTQNFAEPIVLQPTGSRILEANCRRCHGALIHESFGPSSGSGFWPQLGGEPRDESFRCVHCHASVGHGERALIGGPKASKYERDKAK